ncbi:hypothetical protein PG637_03500 [Riemerella anatipestifer]|nr:hypothetical protein [Riemerella anatipestifer]MDY3324737.1 hypothetical protein [Riemerella anatipestifer]MDY3353547.1 hypothetical protein [Riemerella anatipestifer]
MNEKDKRFIALWQNLRQSRLKFSVRQGVVIAFMFILIAAPINYFITKPDDFKAFLGKNGIIWLAASATLSLYYYFVGFNKYEKRYKNLINQ